MRGQGAGEPGVGVGVGVGVGLEVRPSAAGELVADGFVALTGLGVLQRAQLAQRLEPNALVPPLLALGLAGYEARDFAD